MDKPTPDEAPGGAIPSDVKKYATQYKELKKKYGDEKVTKWLGTLGMNMGKAKSEAPATPEPSPDVTEAPSPDMMAGAMPPTYR